MSSFLNNSSNVALEVPELVFDGMWGILHSYFSNPQPLDIEKEDSKLQEVDSQQIDTIERKQGMLMDTLSEFYKLYIEIEENDDSHQDTIMKDMEKSVSKTCSSVGRSQEAYYQRLSKAYNHILKSRFTNGFNGLKPSINIYDISRSMKEIASAPWKVKELPGRSPQSQWPSALGDLNDRLMKLEPMSAWSEPLFSEDGKDIFEQAEEFILKTVNLSDKENKKTEEVLVAALSALIGLSVLSADYSRILSTLSIIYEISEKYQDADKIVSKLAKTMRHYINQLKNMHNDTKSYHHLAQGSFYGCIALPKEAEADFQVETTSSLTTDGTYLYLYWCSGKGGMFKIGTGEGNSLAGKVYLHAKTELSGSLQWVYLNNKIYARKVDESLGVLTLISPDNFLTLGTVSLQCDDKDLFINASSTRINKSYPLLTDGTYLYIIIMHVTTRERVIKEKYKAEVEELRKKENEKQKDTKTDATPEKSDDVSAAIIRKKSEHLFGRSNSSQPNPVNDGDSIIKITDSLKEAKICEFYLLEFDTDLEKYQKLEKSDYLNNKDVLELYESFSCYFSFEECYRALKMNSDDVQLAAQWLVDEGNQECKNIMISRRKTLLAESEVINDKLNNRNEVDIIVKNNSILIPNDIADSSWTINKGQVTCNKYNRNDYSTKVFSIYDQDVRIISCEGNKEEPSEVSEAKIAKIRNNELSDNSDSDEDIKSPDLKRSGYDGGRNESQVISPNYDAAMNMYEKLTLKGSFIKAIKDVKIFDHRIELSFDHVFSKFYALVTSQNSKSILVAQDMTQLRESCFSTEEDISKCGIPDENEDNNLTLKILVQKALEFFMHFERIRFDLPWRWRKWSTIFSTALNYGGSKDNKISKRFEKVKEWELNEWRKKFGLDQIATSKYKKTKENKKSITQSSTYNPYSQSNTSKNSELDKAYWVEERKIQAFCISGDIRSLDILFNFLKKAQIEFKEKVLHLNEEYIKDVGFSEINNLQKLKIPGNENENIIFILLKQLAYWIRISDTLVSMDFNVAHRSNLADKGTQVAIRENIATLFSKGNPLLLDQVGEFLLKLVTEEFNDNIMINLDEYYRLVWVVIIIGFELFYRNAESQFSMIKTLFSHSFKHKRLSTSAKRDKIVNHCYYLDLFNTCLSPIQLFFTVHYKYPQTFLFRVPLVCSEIKEYLLKFKISNDEKPESKAQDSKASNFDYVPSSSNKFIQKQTQFFNLITASDGILDCKLNSILDEYHTLFTQHSDNLILDSAQEIQSCTTISQRDFCSPFSMFFLLDQSISWVDNDAKRNKKPEGQTDEEAEQSDDAIVDLYLNLLQPKPIQELLSSNGFELTEKPADSKAKKPTKKKQPKNKAAKSEKIDEEVLKKIKEDNDKIEKETKEKRREILRNVFQKEIAVHQERASVLWNEFTTTIVKMLNNAREFGAIEIPKATPEVKEIINSMNNIRYIWKIFNRMVEDSLAIKQNCWINSEKNKPFLIKAINFGEECLKQLTDIPLSNNIYEIKWMRCLFKYLQIVLTQSVNDLKQMDFANKAIVSYMSIINMLSKLLGVKTNKETDMIKIADTQQSLNGDSIVQGFYSGGVDYTNEKIFETPHPYPRGDFSSKETYHFSKAIAVQIRFDPRCHCDSNNNSLQISTNDHSFWFNDSFGTQIRCSGRPHNKNPIILLPGNRVSVEFRNNVSNRRKQESKNDDLADRYGYRISINPIYTETSYSSDILINSLNKRPKQQNKAKNKDLYSWVTLLNALVHGASVMSQALIKGNDAEKVQNNNSKSSSRSAVTWNLLRGGIATVESSQISTNVISEYVNHIKEESGIAFEVCSKIKEFAPIFETKLPPHLASKFDDNMKKRWEYISRLSMICLMYHADILKDIFMQCNPEQIVLSDPSKTEEMMKVVWRHTLNISKWVQTSFNGEKEAHILIIESLKIAQNIINDKKASILKKWTENKERELKAKLDKEEQECKAKAKEEEEKAKSQELVQPELKKKTTSSINQKVSVSKDTNRAKKANRKKLINQITVPKTKKKGKDEKNEKELEEVKKEIVEEDKKEQKEDKPPEISDKELNSLNLQIYNDVYAYFISKLKEEQLLKSLCSRYCIKFNQNDTKTAIKQICKILREKIKQFIDFKNPSLIKNINEFDLSSLDSPEVVVLKEVEDKLMFLLQINPSIDLSSKILENDSNEIASSSQFSKDMNLLYSLDKFIEFEDVNDFEISLAKSKSVSINQLGKSLLLKQKSRKGKDIMKFMSKDQSTKINEGQEHKSPLVSSFYSVVSFVTNSTIRNLDLIKENINTHYKRADDRIKGIEYYNSLLKFIIASNQSRSILNPLVIGVGENPFVSIEACGIEKLKQINRSIKDTLRYLCTIFIRDYSKLKTVVAEFIRSKLNSVKTNSRQPSIRSSSSDEMIVISQIRALLECLNDMIVILSENPSREAFILNIVISFSKIKEEFKEFLEKLIGLILDTKDSLIILNKSHISETLISQTQIAAKLLLNKFIINNKEDMQISNESHTMLQEILLEIIINMLHNEIKKTESNENDISIKEKFIIEKFQATKYQRLVTLFILLRTVLKMSSDRKHISNEIKNKCLDLVSECISTDNSINYNINEERHFSTRVIRAACQVAKLCLDKNKILKNFGKNKNESFIEMICKKIGQCITISDERALSSLETFVIPLEDHGDIFSGEIIANKQEEIELKELSDSSDKQLDENSKLDSESVSSTSELKSEYQDQRDPRKDTAALADNNFYNVYAYINNNSDDCSFLVTALCELDKQWNLINEKLTTDGNNSKELSITEDVKIATDSTNKVGPKIGLGRLIKFAMEIENSMKSKGTTKISMKHNMTLKEARFVAETFYKAYEGEIPPIQISTETINQLNKSKVLSGINVAQVYPSLCNKSEVNVHRAAPQPGQGPLIKLSRDQLKMTICKQSSSSSKIDNMTKKLISHRKFCIDNNSRKLVRTGLSSSLIVQDLRQLARELLFSESEEVSVQSTELNQEMMRLINDSLKSIINNEIDTNLLYGTLEVVAGIINIVQPGSQVKLNINGKECIGTVVDGGHYSGKLDISVVIENERVVTKITPDQTKESKLFEMYEGISWKQELLPEFGFVNEAIIACFKNISENSEDKKDSKSGAMGLVLLQLLKILLLFKDSQIDLSNTNMIEPLLSLCDEYRSKSVEIPSDECEIEFCESWRRIVDKLEPVLNYHYTLNSLLKSKNGDKLITPNNSDIHISEHALPSSSYDQLPRPKPKTSESKAAIRLLAYWEKNIIPRIIEFVRSTYRPWEMEFAFEQLRFPLRHGDQQKALEEALIMLEKKIPAGCIIPDDSYDWSAKMPEECIVGSWFLVKLQELKSIFGIDEIVVMLKAIDLESKIGLVEYVDVESMRYNIWIPLKYMYDPPVPLNTPAACSSLQELKNIYKSKLMATSAFYAKKIIINHFTTKGSIRNILDHYNEYSNCPITGVKNTIKDIKDNSSSVYLENISKANLTKNDLGELVYLCDNNMKYKEDTDSSINSKNQLIETEFINMINAEDKNDLQQFCTWIHKQWDVLSENINKQRIDIDICREYQKYTGISDAASVTPEGQEIIECRDNSILLPLHSLFSPDNSSRLNVGMAVTFDRHSYFCCSTATMKFYSDERGANMIAEISSASEQGVQIRPLLFDYGKVWCIFDAGTSAILPKHMQSNVTISLKCTISLIPYEWTTCCTVTNCISNSLMKSHKKENEELEKTIYGGLIAQLIKFFRSASAPASINSIILQILNKLIQNYRTLRLKSEDQTEDGSVQKHFERIQVDKEFIQSLIFEADMMRTNQSEYTGPKSMFSSYIQNLIELIVGTLLPTSRKEKLNTLSDLIECPKWLESVAQAGQILAHLESSRNQLSVDVEEQIYEQTKISSQWERVLIISKLPLDFTRAKIEQKLMETIRKNRGTILDIYIPYSTDFESTKSDVQALLSLKKQCIDVHQRKVEKLNAKIKAQLQKNLNEKQEKETAESQPKVENKQEKKKELEVIQEDIKEAEYDHIEEVKIEQQPDEIKTEGEVAKDKIPDINWQEFNHQGVAIIVLDEYDLALLTEDDQKEGEGEGEEEEVKEEAPGEQIYNCPACTLENPMTNESCAICGTPRPPDAGMSKGNVESKEVDIKDPATIIEERYKTAIKNRTENILNGIKNIVKAIVDEESSEKAKRETEINRLKSELECAKTNKLPAKSNDQKTTPPKKTESLTGDSENMNLNQLFGEPDADMEEAIRQSLENQPQPVLESKPPEEVKQEQNEKKEEEKKEEVKQEEVEKEEPEEVEPTIEPREEVKIFFGNTVDDDYKSELFLNSYLKDKLLTGNNQLSQECERVFNEIAKGSDLSGHDQTPAYVFDDEDYDMTSNKESFIKICLEEPRRIWRFIEKHGYDICFQLSVFRNILECRECKIARSDKDMMLKLITIDICNNSILSPTFRGGGLRKMDFKYHNYEINRDFVMQKYAELMDRIGLREIRFMWALLRFLNKQLHTSIYLIFCSETTNLSSIGDSFSLSRLISKFRIIFSSIKFDLKLSVLDKTSIDREKPPELIFERLKIAHLKHEKNSDTIEVEPLSDSESEDSISERPQEENEVDHSSLMLNSYQQMRNIDITLLRPRRPQGAEPHLSFSVLLRGEHVVGEGGPYRQFFADLSSEIQPAVYTPGSSEDDESLIIPSPNRLGDVKDYREYYVINPTKISTQDLALYEYLGVLMGVCIRTNVHLTLDLATICWKQLVGEQITLQDLNEVDIGFVNRCKCILETDKEVFQDTIFDSFAINLSDGSIIELCEDGVNIPVTFENKNDFLVKAISARISEFSMQCKAIKLGICKIVPEGLINLLTADELKEAVCGKIKLDLELLKRNTEYGGSNPREMEKSKQVKWLWEVLSEISEEDKLKFIVFCWGQERLPANDEEFKLSKTRFMIKPSLNQSYGDGTLPRANTCFFNFELPNYSNKEILRDKILLAIRTDNRSMNAEQQELIEHLGRNDMFGGNNDDDY